MKNLFYTRSQLYALIINTVATIALAFITQAGFIHPNIFIAYGVISNIVVGYYQHSQEHTYFDFDNIMKWAFIDAAVTLGSALTIVTALSQFI